MPGAGSSSQVFYILMFSQNLSRAEEGCLERMCVRPGGRGEKRGQAKCYTITNLISLSSQEYIRSTSGFTTYGYDTRKSKKVLKREGRRGLMS